MPHTSEQHLTELTIASLSRSQPVLDIASNCMGPHTWPRVITKLRPWWPPHHGPIAVLGNRVADPTAGDAVKRWGAIFGLTETGLGVWLR